MIDYPVFIGLWAIVLVFLVLNRSRRINSPERVLYEEGEVVFCRDLPLSRIFKLRGKAILKSDVVSVQRDHRRISLLFAGGKALDIWLPKTTVELVSDKAQSLFPQAEFKRVDAERVEL